VVHGQAGADQAEHFGDAARVPDDRLAEHRHRGVSDLGIVDVARALVDLAADLGDAAQRGVQERGVDQVIQPGGDEQAFQRLVEALREAAAVPQVLPGEPVFARLSNYGDSAISYTLRVWTSTADYWDAYFDILERVRAAFDQRGIEMTYPHLNVHMREP